MIEEQGVFVEVWVKAAVEECARRDVKGLYAKALAGEIEQFTGVSDPYEPPSRPELVVDTEHETPEESLARVVALLESLGVVDRIDGRRRRRRPVRVPAAEIAQTTS
jgi:adenylylsulfate kinase-like enzyme